MIKRKVNGILGSKRGNVLLESFFITIVLVALAFITVGGYIASEEIQSILENDEDLAAEALAIGTDVNDRYDNTMDGIFAWALGILWIIIIVLSFFVDSHPAFYIISIVLLVGLLIAAGYISNAYEAFEADPNLSTYIGDFPMMNFIMNNLMMVIAVLGVSIALALYAKQKIG